VRFLAGRPEDGYVVQACIIPGIARKLEKKKAAIHGPYRAMNALAMAKTMRTHNKNAEKW
jgi:hypothetical protein